MPLDSVLVTRIHEAFGSSPSCSRMLSWTLDLSFIQKPCKASDESRCTDSVVNERGGFRLGGDAPYQNLAALDELFWIGDPRNRSPTVPVELIGIEPTTSGLQSPRSPS